MSIPDRLPPTNEESPVGIRSGIPDRIQHTNGKISKVPKQESLVSDSDISIPEVLNKKRHYIYLAGNISEDPRTYEWREKFVSALADEQRVVTINPCANKFNQGMKNASKSGLEFTRRAKELSQRILRAKDYQLVKICSVIVAHLGYSSKEKPMIGTIQELTWARDVFYIPVIGITGGEDNIYTNHPWIDECCSAKVETVEEAVEIIKTFFLDY